MKAYTTRGDGVAALRLEERPVPEPGPGQVRVRMTAASLNFRDLLVIEGREGWRPSVPRVPGSDGVGIVDAVGEGVSRFAPGARVAGIFLPRWLDGELTAETYVEPLGGPAADGVLAEYRLFHQDALVPVPDPLSDVEAATLPVAGVTAWHAVGRRAPVRPGDRVLIQGTGGVSLFALQFAHALGASCIVLSSSAGKLRKARALGAAATVDYGAHPRWEDEVLALTSGRGVDHVVEVVGGENLNRSLRVVRVSGSIRFIGLLAGLAAPVNTYEFVTRNVDIHGIETGSREMFEEMNRFISLHRLRPVVEETYPFGELGRALARLQSRSRFGKIAIRF